MAKERSYGGQTEVNRKLYPQFRHSLSLATLCPLSSLVLTILYPLFDPYPSIAFPLAIAMDKQWSTFGQTKVNNGILDPLQYIFWGIRHALGRSLWPGT